MAQNNPFDDLVFRLRTLLVLMLLAFTGLVYAMWRVQVAGGEQYQEDLNTQSVRRVRLPGARGRIFDRAGRCLADNRPSYSIALYMEEIRRGGNITRNIDRAELVIDRLSEVLGIPRAVTRKDIAIHAQKRLPLPLLIWKDVDQRVMARFAERAAQVPGTDIYLQALRTYPAGKSGCHIVGFVGRADIAKEEHGAYHYYLPEMKGRDGIERQFDQALRGEAGGRLVRIDVSGFRHEDIGHREARPGSDIQLSIDLRIQQLAEEVLADTPGSLVVMDPRNGDILALASAPGFDPNEFVPSISTKKWAAINNDDRNPLINRSISGAYPPGSTFKPVVAFAALENAKAKPMTQFSCPGYFELGKTRFRCWTRGQHGLLSMREALKQSCNVYFYRLGLQVGKDYIYHMATALGLGSPTGIELPGERKGLVPSSSWSRRVHGVGWRPGDTCNFSIGQGALTVTPLQMASITATVANGGHVYKPRLVKGIRASTAKNYKPLPPVILNEMNWSSSSLDVVRGGMRDVVMAERGTGKLARIDGINISGKTGTAEYGPKELNKKRGWMIAFAPSESPRYAVALVIDDAVSGGVTVAPRIKKLMEGLFGVQKKSEGEG